MQNTKLRYGMDMGDQLLALEEAMSSVKSAMEELNGIGELSDIFDALNNDLREMEYRKDHIEHEISIQVQAEQMDMGRDYYRSVI